MKTLTIEKTTTEPIEIGLPAFFKEKYCNTWIAIFSENERFIIFGNSLCECTESISDTFKRNLEEISKSEFFDKVEESREATDKLFHSIDVINELDNTIQSELDDRNREMSEESEMDESKEFEC